MTTTAPGGARALREATRPDHAASEHSPFMTALLEGWLPRDAYADLLVQLHTVYDALETAAPRFAADPVAGAFVDPALHRRRAIERDLDHLTGAGWGARFGVCDPAARYAARIAACADAASFVAHHYTRYLGDLSGGQVIGRAVRRAYGLRERGASFYEFDGISDAKAYKDTYRARLDTAPLDTATLTAEVTVAYAFNAATLTALTERHLP